MTIPIPDPRPAIGSRWKMCSHMEPGDPGIWETGTLIEYVGDWVRFAMETFPFCAIESDDVAESVEPVVL